VAVVSSRRVSRVVWRLRAQERADYGQIGTATPIRIIVILKQHKTLIAYFSSKDENRRPASKNSNNSKTLGSADGPAPGPGQGQDEAARAPEPGSGGGWSERQMVARL
jgi:hypothetical protein